MLIPAGVHRVLTRPQAESSGQSELHIESINGTIVGAERSGQHVRLTYESRGRCYVTLNRAPKTVLCDGALGVGKVLSNGVNGGNVCVVLPQGKHTVEME